MSFQKRKFQVFISSTFEDMKDERQAAVAAVLNSGHIPAGMELFSAGSESQLDTIYKWILDSDVYILLLGGRYGTVEPNSGLSYTELEYRFAVDNNIPHFAIVIEERALDEKLVSFGANAIEKKNPDKMSAFRSLALSKSCRFYADPKDIQISIMQRLNELSQDPKLKGWVKRDDISAPLEAAKLQDLLDENVKLKSLLEGVDVEISLPTLPKLSDFTDVTISYSGHGQSKAVKIKGTWGAFFPIFVSSLKCSFGDWGGRDYFSVDEMQSRSGFSRELLYSVQGFSEAYTILNAADFQRLYAFYTELRLANDMSGSEPFTELGSKVARRSRIANGLQSDLFEVVVGKLPFEVQIPF